MNFHEQIDNIFNRRRTGLSDNEQRALHYCKEELIDAHNSLRQLGIDNHISFTANIIDHCEQDYNDTLREAGYFLLDLDNIINMLRSTEHPDDWDGELDEFDDLKHTINRAYNKLVLEAGFDNALHIEVNIQIINNLQNDTIMPLHWQPSEPLPNNMSHSNNISYHVEADNLVNMGPHWQPSEEYHDLPDLIDEDGNVVHDNTYNHASVSREWENCQRVDDILAAQAQGEIPYLEIGPLRERNILPANVTMDHNNNEDIYENAEP